MTSFVLCQYPLGSTMHATRIVPVRPLGLHPMHHHGCFLSIQSPHICSKTNIQLSLMTLAVFAPSSMRHRSQLKSLAAQCFLMSYVHSKESLYETPKRPKRTPKETLTFKAPTCSNTMQTWEVEVPKCKYHAKWEVEVPKCHTYHAKWQVLVPNCCKYKANGTRK
jgi:hypothetical protein